MMYSGRNNAYWLWPLWGKGPISLCWGVSHGICFHLCKAADQSISSPVSLFSSMHRNELNIILKYGRELMRKNEQNAQLSCRLHCPSLFPCIHRRAASILTADVSTKAETHLQCDALTPPPRPHTHTHIHAHTHEQSKTDAFNTPVWKVKCTKEIASANLLEDVMRWNCLCRH